MLEGLLELTRSTSRSFFVKSQTEGHYSAAIRHADEEVHRINIDAQVMDQGAKAARPTYDPQKLYWSD